MQRDCGSRSWCLLELHQINFQGNYLTVKGKGSKVRAVPFGKWAREKLVRYIVRNRPRLLKGKSSPFLFPNRSGQAAHPPGILEDYPALRSGCRHR